jgi:hypothetical protein
MPDKTPDDGRPKDGKADDKKAKRAGLKLPPIVTRLTFEGMLLVFVPFIVFVMVFLYTMGLVPPRAAVIQVSAATVQAAGVGGVAGGSAEVASPAVAGGERKAAQAEQVEAPAGPDITPALVDSALAGDLPVEGAQADSSITRQARADSVTVALAEERAKRMKQIAKVYEQMTPSSVAAIVANMPETDAVEILSRMTPRGAAKILSVLDPEKAARFSLELAQ